MYFAFILLRYFPLELHQKGSCFHSSSRANTNYPAVKNKRPLIQAETAKGTITIVCVCVSLTDVWEKAFNIEHGNFRTEEKT